MLDIYNVIVWCIIYWLLVVVHEAGHLSAAILVGYTWREIQAGPVAIVRRGSEFHLIFSKRWLSGRVTIEWHPRPYCRKRAAVIYASGPLANLGLSVFLILLFCQLSPAQRDIYWRLPILAVTSLCFFASSLVPVKVKKLGLKSDGLNLLNLWRQQLTSKRP